MAMVAERVSLGRRLWTGFSNRISSLVRNPYVRVGVASLGLGLMAVACGKGKPAEMTYHEGRGTLVIPEEAKNDWAALSGFVANNEILSPGLDKVDLQIMTDCFRAANGNAKTPAEAMRMDRNGDAILKPTRECMAGALPQAAAAAPPPPQPTADQPGTNADCPTALTLPALDQLTATVDTLKRTEATPVIITLPAGFKPTLPIGPYIPQEQMDVLLEAVITNNVITGYTLRRGAQFPRRGDAPKEAFTLTFDIFGDYEAADAASGIIVKRTGIPVSVLVTVNELEWPTGGGGQGGGSAVRPPETTGGLTPPGSLTDAILGNQPHK